jgi:hypothetical protein
MKFICSFLMAPIKGNRAGALAVRAGTPNTSGQLGADVHQATAMEMLQKVALIADGEMLWSGETHEWQKKLDEYAEAVRSGSTA